MPVYDFQCNRCQTVFEVRASIKEKEAGLEPECPHCDSPDVHQVLTAGLLLRGSGAAISSPACGPNAGLGCCG